MKRTLQSQARGLQWAGGFAQLGGDKLEALVLAMADRIDELEEQLAATAADAQQWENDYFRLLADIGGVSPG